MLPPIEKLICPVCRGGLKLHDRSAKCPWRHSYDFAKQGYLNLLLPNQKQSKDPGDGPEMVQARRQFHQADHYKSLSHQVSKHLLENSSVLDLGCGEGSYAKWIVETRADLCYYGSDISRHAIKVAASQLKQATFTVASNFNLPLKDQGFDHIITIFAPVAQSELKRLITPEGSWINVTPGTHHLEELRAALYDDVEDIDKQHQFDGWTLATEESLTYPMTLDRADLQHLVTMTPYAWQAPKQKRKAIDELDGLDLTADFKVSVYKQA